MYGRVNVPRLPHTKEVLLERAQRVRIAAMRARHEASMLWHLRDYAKPGSQKGIAFQANNLELRAAAYDRKADQLVREAMEMGDEPSRDNSHHRSANNAMISRT